MVLANLSSAVVHNFKTEYVAFQRQKPELAFKFFVFGAAVKACDLPERLVIALNQLGVVSPLSGSLNGELESQIRLFDFCGLLVATDLMWYREPSALEGMAMPMHPENALLIESISPKPGAKVLDIGFGSGIFSMTAARRGAANVIGLDVSERAKRFASFNVLLNELEPAKFDWRINPKTTPSSALEPVLGERFDLILSNPPFEVSTDDFKRACAYGGSDGLDFFRALLPYVSEYLNDDGEAHFVFFSVGNREEPSGVLDITHNIKGDILVEWAENPLKTEAFFIWNYGQTRHFPPNHEYLWFGRVRIKRAAEHSLTTRRLAAISNWHWPIHAQTPLGYDYRSSRSG